MRSFHDIHFIVPLALFISVLNIGRPFEYMGVPNADMVANFVAWTLLAGAAFLALNSRRELPRDIRSLLLSGTILLTSTLMLYALKSGPMPGLEYNVLQFGYHLMLSAFVFATAWRQHGKNKASDTLDNPAKWQIDEECRRYWEPTDPNDIAFLQMANESRFQSTTLPSGYKTPNRPCISRNGRLYDGRDLDLGLS